MANQRQWNAFGELALETNPSAAAGTPPVETSLFGFTGLPFDTRTGLQHNRARWLDPSTHTFLSPDPIADDPHNSYRYVGNSPTFKTDPYGLAEMESGTGAFSQSINELLQLPSSGGLPSATYYPPAYKPTWVQRARIEGVPRVAMDGFNWWLSPDTAPPSAGYLAFGNEWLRGSTRAGGTLAYGVGDLVTGIAVDAPLMLLEAGNTSVCVLAGVRPEFHWEAISDVAAYDGSSAFTNVQNRATAYVKGVVLYDLAEDTGAYLSDGTPENAAAMQNSLSALFGYAVAMRGGRSISLAKTSGKAPLLKSYIQSRGFGFKQGTGIKAAWGALDDGAGTFYAGQLPNEFGTSTSYAQLPASSVGTQTIILMPRPLSGGWRYAAAIAPIGGSLRPITPYRDPARPGYNNGATHIDHAQARSLGGTNDQSNLRPLAAETNLRKGGYEGALKRYEDMLRRAGLSREDARSVIQSEIDALRDSVVPRPMDTRVMDRLPGNPLDQDHP